MLGLEAGAGVGPLRGALSIGRGLRGISFGAMGRLVREVGAFDVGFGVGVSSGPGLHDLVPDEETGDQIHFGADTFWLDIEISMQAGLGESGFVRTYIGLTNPRDVDCDAEHEDTGPTTCDAMQVATLEREEFMPFVGIGVGFRWPPARKSRPRPTPPRGPSPWSTIPGN